MQLVETQVISPALEDREPGLAGQRRRQRLSEAGEIAVHELALQRNGGRRYHHRGGLLDGVRKCGHQVCQGFTGAGTGLDHQMLTAVQGVLDGGGHGELSGTFSAAEGRDGGG
ncbi:Uncharacterised protein [Mycobacteroides abscessus subsp. abscessus]|nr:Uncharacterised protein [Mycobacteroides abscessus subsp. abscessus]